MAASLGHDHVVAALLADERTDPNLLSSFGTPLEEAIIKNNRTVIDLFLTHPRVNLIGIGHKLAALATKNRWEKQS